MTSITFIKRDFSKLGGAEKYARHLAHAFYEKGCQVTVLTTHPITNTFPFPVIAHPLKSKLSVTKIWEFEKFCQNYLKSNPTKLVFGLDRSCFQTHLRASSGVHRSFLNHRKMYESKWKNCRHSFNPLHRTLLHMEKMAFENPNLKVLFANSHLVKEEILKFYQVDPNKITVIPNGVEWDEYEPSFANWPQKKSSSKFEFLFLGNDFARKGLRPLLFGLKALAEKNFHLSIVGTDKNEKQFVQLVKTLGLTEKISFYGSQTNVLPFYQAADCLVIPSFYDPFANVTIEALAMGLFVISSKTNGGSEVLSSESGTTIENLLDQNSMKNALEIALNHPKTSENAQTIRNSVQFLDFKNQLNTYVEKCLSPTYSFA